MTKRCHLHRAAAALTFTSVLLSSTPPVVACGPWLPRQYLAQGGMSLLETPRFFLEIELKLIARDYPTPFHAVHDKDPFERTRQRDLEDFDAALAAGTIHPADPVAARVAHERMREAIRQYAELTPEERAALPEGVLEPAKKGIFPSEFADYHEGLLAYSMGDHDGARAIWERLLARPEPERRYRSVAAAFMIAVLGVVEDWDDAPEWFERARDMARRGFPDDAGLAAATYWRESEWHEARGDSHKAAECAMRGISSGYPAQEYIGPKDDSPEELANFARDPLLRKIHTSRLLALATNPYNSDLPHRERLEKWLGALESASVREFAGAERVAWLCYASAEYGRARRWLARAPKDSPRTLWLAGKLAARDGKRAESLRAFSAATRLLARAPEPPLEITVVSPEDNTTADRMAAEHAIAAIGAPEFRTALEAFLRGGHWVDAAYVAERLLSVEELRSFVARWQAPQFQKQPEREPEDVLEIPRDGQADRLRWLLARRLMREGRPREAQPYFPPEWRPACNRYAQALARGNNRRVPATERGLALWDAAVEYRYHGIELFGTEAAPDWFVYEGNFEEDDPVPFRRGEIAIREDRYSDTAQVVPLPAILKESAVERARLNASEPAPYKRYHYRYRAASLAWDAAQLLPDNDPRTADLLNLAGRWMAPRAHDVGERFYRAIERRCANTDLGRRAIAAHWFVEVNEADFAVRHRPEKVEVPAS